MKAFNKNQTGIITIALNQLSLEKYIEEFYIFSDVAQIQFDDFSVRIISPMDNTLQFTLFDGSGENIIKTIVTEKTIETLPVKRLILSLLGVLMLQAFETEWDGYTFQELPACS